MNPYYPINIPIVIVLDYCLIVSLQSNISLVAESTMVYGRQTELVNGVRLNQLVTWGHNPVIFS